MLFTFMTALTLAGQPGDSTTVTVVLPLFKEAATQCVIAAFTDNRLTVAQSEGGIITTVPFIPNPGGFSRAELVYRATVLSADTGHTRVVLSGTYHAVDAGAMSQAVSGLRVESPGYPLKAPRKMKESDRQKWGWPKLDIFAEALRACH